ncbi:MAG: A4/G1 family peptidase [Candidatus Thermoplasmatota archaeon]|nr:A4/G1 family peptidase [Candidatus Thermoplasmatota archaeon]MDA8143818.1 hypothetical protein [Thermoplasmatales archaeon]
MNIRENKIALLVTIIVVWILFILPFSQSSGNLAHGPDGSVQPSISTQIGFNFIFSNASMQRDVNALNETAKVQDKKFAPSKVLSEIVSGASALYQNHGFQSYANKFSKGSLQWGLMYNFTSGSLTVYADFVQENATSQTYYTFGVDGSTHHISGPSVNTQPIAHSSAYYNSPNWAGYELYFSPQEIYSSSATLGVSNIVSPPSNQISGKFMSTAVWVGLTEYPGGHSSSGVQTLAQTGYSRVYDKQPYQFWTGPYWHNYHIWYETLSPNHPNSPSYNYPGSPDLSPGWQIRFNVFDSSPDFTYSAYITNTSQNYVVTSNHGNFPTYYAQYITEAENLSYISQIAEFYPSVQFQDPLIEVQGVPGEVGISGPYQSGYYNEYYLEQSPNNLNIANSFGPQMLWSNSYYDYSYVNG